MSATNFPGALDNFVNPAPTNATSGSSAPGTQHSQQHAQANDAIEAIEVKIGIDGSTDPNSLDYKVSSLFGWLQSLRSAVGAIWSVIARSNDAISANTTAIASLSTSNTDVTGRTMQIDSRIDAVSSRVARNERDILANASAISSLPATSYIDGRGLQLDARIDVAVSRVTRTERDIAALQAQPATDPLQTYFTAQVFGG